MWESYLTYLNHLSKFINQSSLNNYTPDLKGEFLSNCFQAAIDLTNKTAPRGGKLKNLWGWLKMKRPIEAVASYVRNINDVGDDEFDKYWKRHTINEQHERSLFVNVDRIKIMTQGINNLILV